jgi:outer membrane protein
MHRLLLVCVLAWPMVGVQVTPLLAQTGVPNPARAVTLADALEMALEVSPEVATAEAAVAMAGGEQRRARSERLPQLMGSAGYVRTLATEFDVLRNGNGLPNGLPGPDACAPFAPDPTLSVDEQIAALAGTVECVARVSPIAGFRDLFADLPFGRRHQYTFGLSLNQPVFAGGRIDAQMRIAERQREVADIGVLASRAQVVLDVAEAYYDAALSDRLVTIAEASLDHADSTLGQALVQYRAGTLAEFDVLRARVLRDNQRPSIIQRRAERDLAHLRLKRLIDVPADVQLDLVAPLEDAPLPPVVTLARLPGTMTEDLPQTDRPRLPVQQALAAVGVQEDRLRVAAAQRWPTISVGSFFSRVVYSERLAPGWDQFRNNWTIDVSLQVPLFTGGRIGGDIRMAEAGLAETRAQLRQTQDLALLDSRNATAQLTAAEAVWAASAGTREEALRALDIAQIRFREGVSTQLEVADTQLQLQQAEINRARAVRDLNVARIRMALLPHLPLTTPSAPGLRMPADPAPRIIPPQPPAQPPGLMPRAADAVVGGRPGGPPR